MANKISGNKVSERLEKELLSDLSDELSVVDENYNLALLLSKIRSAIRSFKGARKYQNNPEFYTDERIEKDLCEYYENIRGLALDRYSRIGADGESSHSENGISRVYEDEKRWFSGVIPISPPPSK